MFQFNASFIDGKVSAARSVQVSVDSTGLISFIEEPPHLPELNINNSVISARLGNTPRKITFPDNALLETSNNEVVDKIMEHFAINKSQNISHRLENNLKLAAIGIFVLIVSAGLFYRYGLPATSNLVTELIPTSVDDMLGEEVLPQLDDFIFEPTQITQEKQQAIKAEFSQLLKIDELTTRNYQLLFRDAPAIGANALALPNATIIVTDDIVNLLTKDELNSVLLHEIGHIQHRHSMRMLVRQTLLSSIVLLATGDPGFANSMVIFVPQVLLETQHSRTLETQSDSFALNHMTSLSIPPKAFAEAMKKIANIRDADMHNSDDNSVLDYLSTHPSSKDRIQRFLEAQRTFEATNSH